MSEFKYGEWVEAPMFPHFNWICAFYIRKLENGKHLVSFYSDSPDRVVPEVRRATVPAEVSKSNKSMAERLDDALQALTGCRFGEPSKCCQSSHPECY